MNDFSNLIKDVIEKADIVDIIGRHVNLEKKGAGYFGLCPFHDDKNPSLSVSPQKKIFKCFSCNAKGNAITFIERFKDITFMEALREVAQTVNIEVKLSQREKDIKINEKYYNILKEASNFYSFYLKNTKEGATARAYLLSRGLNDEIIEKFNIGLAPSDKDLLYQTLIKQNFLAIDIAEVGLVGLSNSYYDVFKRRIMFPLKDIYGQIVGFSGRIYDNSNEAKYLNSSENIIFKKNELLYNYYEASSTAKEQNNLFIFEGFMDVIAASLAGVNNSVAIMGTALTRNQIKAISRLTNNVSLALDSDTAGIEATHRAISLFAAENFNINIVSFPSGLDPDDYLRKNSKAKLKDFLLNNKVNALDFIYNEALKKLIPENIASLEAFKSSIFSVLKLYPSATTHDIYIQKMAETLKVSKESLFYDFNRQETKPINDFIPPFEHVVKVRKPKINQKEKFLYIQKNLIYLALHYQEYLLEINDSFNEHFLMDEYEEIMSLASSKKNKSEIFDLVGFAQELSNEARTIYYELLNMDSRFRPRIESKNQLISDFSNWPYIKRAEETNDLNEQLKCKQKIVKIIKKEE